MTDQTVAPPPAPPAPANEAVINQNPVNSPNPIGSQAPEKPDGARPTARESIQKAFDRANNPAPKPARPANTQQPQAKPAEAKMGHNQPPEATDKLDLKRRPADQPRGERGQFAPREAQNAQNRAPGAQNSANGAQNSANGAQNSANGAQNALPPHAPYSQPPARMADHAKRDWAAAPESVRGEVHRMHHEFSQAFQQHRASSEAFRPIAKFHHMAQTHGTTLEKALTNYVGIEQKLRSDPLAGLETIVYNLGLQDPQTGKRIDLRDIAYTVLSQSPEQLRLLKQGNAQTAAGHQIGALHQEIAGLKNYLAQMHTQQQFSHNRSAVDQFAATHPRLDELGVAIENELRLGFDLPTAYKRAELLYPATQAAQTRDPSAQTRTVDRSISGAPAAGPSNGAARRRETSPTVSAAVQKAIRSTMNGVM